MIVAAHRHHSTSQIVRWFDYGHLPEGSAARRVSAACTVAAAKMIEELDDSPELVAGLRKLLEAKDCFVRAAIASQNTASSTPITHGASPA